MKALKKVGAFLTALLVILSFSALFACNKDLNILPSTVLTKLCEKEKGLPYGNSYNTEASEGEDEFLPKEMLITSYNFPADFDGIESAAIRVSGNMHPCEFAIFHCKNTSNVQDVTLFCKDRLKVLKQNARAASELCEMNYDEYIKYIDSASVVAKGLYVALIISSDTNTITKEFYNALP